MSPFKKKSNLFILLTVITFFIFSCSKNIIIITEKVEPNGKKLLIESKKKSKIVMHKSYYANGILEYEVELRDGIPDGESTFWDIDGNLLNIANYENGKLHGISVRYFKNRKIASKIEYFYGDIHGVSETFYNNGKIKSHQVFNYGEQISILLRFDENGSRIYQP